MRMGITEHAINSYRERVAEDLFRETRPDSEIYRILRDSAEAAHLESLLNEGFNHQRRKIMTVRIPINERDHPLGVYRAKVRKRRGKGRETYVLVTLIPPY